MVSEDYTAHYTDSLFQFPATILCSFHPLPACGMIRIFIITGAAGGAASSTGIMYNINFEI
jgi:hypothetical protein